MIFTHLSLTNFGVYAGRHEFDLRPQHRKGNVHPVVLFGGKNGAGKTTILEAIRLCLYGRTAFGVRVRRTDYESFIRQRLHRGSQDVPGAKTASIELQIEHTHAGVMHKYHAMRSWSPDGQGIHEQISIYKDGKRFQEIAPERWNDFLRDLIPPGVADLFFFDGEDIQSLADDDNGTEALGTAIRGLLNLDLVDRLRADLSVYLRQQAEQEQSRLHDTAKEVIQRQEHLEQCYGEYKQDRAQLNARLEHVTKELDQQRQKMVREGVSFIQQRTLFETRQAEIGRDINQIEDAIRDSAGNLLPFAVSPEWSLRLRRQLAAEAAAERQRLTREAQCTQAHTVAQTLLDRKFQERTATDVSNEQWTTIARAVHELLTPPAETDRPKSRHPLSDQERETLQSWITTAINESPRQLHALTGRLGELEAERTALEQSLKQIPNEAMAQPLIDTFNVLAEKKGGLQLEFAQVDEKVQELRRDLDDVQRQRTRIEEQLSQAHDVSERIRRAAQVQVVLEQYLARMTAIKLGELEQALAQYFNVLCRKRMLVREVKIDPRDFTVQLYGANRTVLHKADLSAGEKQLYALALLWALRSVSGRALPIIVDTPMGRLDSDHRAALLTHFFPHAAHQVVLLSTDTEIDEAAFNMLQEAVSHTFRLEFDQEQGSTQVQRGYFTPQVDGVFV